MAGDSTSSKTRVLVVADEAGPRVRVVEALTKLGVPALSGFQVDYEFAAERACRVRPDIAVLVVPANAEVLPRVLGEFDTLPGCRVLVVGPVEKAQHILDVMHAGADEYLDQTRLEEELTAALLRHRLKATSATARRSHGRVIGVIGAAGGCGASTIAINVATCLARAHSEAVLVDLRLQSADLAALLNLRPEHTLADFCERAERVDQQIFDQLLTPHASGVKLIAAPIDPLRIGDVTPRGISRALMMARSRCPYIVVDLDNHLGEVQSEALWQLDQLLLVLRLDFTSVRNTRRLLIELDGAGFEMSQVRLVANRFRQPRELPLREAEEALGRRIEVFVRDDPRRINRSVNTGNPVVLYAPRSGVARELSSLAALVNGRTE